MASAFRGLGLGLAARKPSSLQRRVIQESRRSAVGILWSHTRQQSSFSRSGPSRSSERFTPLTPPLSKSFHTSPPSRSTSKFTYGIAALFTAKDRRYNPETNVFNFNPYNHIKARRKDKRTRPDSGQDTFFISRVGESLDVTLGVVDGVGGWIDSGVDPADFAHGFCDYMAHAAYTY